LFRTTSRSNNRTELVVLITPRALQNDEQLRAVSDEMRRHFARSLGAINGLKIDGVLPEEIAVPAVQSESLEPPAP